MGWFGKIVGGAFGMTVGGPLGAIMGASFGHSIDSVGDKKLDKLEESQVIYFTAAFSLLGKMAKIDDGMSLDEVELIYTFMDEMGLSDDARHLAKEVFYKAKESDHSFHQIARQFYESFSDKPDLMKNLIDMLFRVAMSDNEYHEEEASMIKGAAEIFKLSEEELSAIEKRYIDNDEKYYAVLEVSKSDPMEKIEVAYNKLIEKYHPDKAKEQGLPEEFTKFYETKLGEVEEAYRRIKG